MDKVFIEQLEVITTIGVYDWEQEIKQNAVYRSQMKVGYPETKNRQRDSERAARIP